MHQTFLCVPFRAIAPTLLLSVLGLFANPLMSQSSVGGDTNDGSETTSPASNLVYLLEIAAAYGNSSRQGPETTGSILSSARLANRLTSNTAELFQETNKAGGSGYTPRIRYSHQLAEGAFIGLTYTKGADVFYDRTTIGNQGAYLKDKTRTRQHQFGVRFGAGPLNYLAPSSGEFSIGYEENSQKGPYLTSGFRLPRYNADTEAFSDMTLFFGNGTIDFRNRAYSMNFGGSFTGDIFGMYVTGELQYLSGSLTLASQTFETDIPAAQIANLRIVGNPEITYVHFPKLWGMLMGVELGMIIKFTENFGIRGGGYYQLASLEFGVPQGVYIENGRVNELSQATQLTSADKRRELGFWGFNVGVITRL